MAKNYIMAILAGFFWMNCQPVKKVQLTIATAANMQFAVEALIQAFQEKSGIEGETVISSSGKLTAQIEEGAPFDVFVSADMKYPQRLYQEGFTTAPPKIYAYGKLVLWTMIDSLSPSIELLKKPYINHIAVANPKTAPYGEATIEVLDHYQVREIILPKLVYGESISQTNQFIISKAAEVGFTAKSVVLSPRMEGQGSWTDLEDGIYTPIAQGVVLLKRAGDRLPAAQKFFDFLFSEKSKEILQRYGYAVYLN